MRAALSFTSASLWRPTQVKGMSIKLSEVIPWGRSYDEYVGMFDLSEHDLAGRILGCGDGPASFNAEATLRGCRVISCDPIYDFTPHQIKQRVLDCHDDMIAQVRRNPDGFVWDRFESPEELGRCRLRAMRRFLADFDSGKADGRYVTSALPNLPFADSQFDLALCSHLLFLYSDHLDFEFHRAAISEMLRVAREVRIFPLLTLDRRQSPHLEPIRGLFQAEGRTAEVRAVRYEFQRGGNQMLRIGL
jgi:hypothetical protein